MPVEYLWPLLQGIGLVLAVAVIWAIFHAIDNDKPPF